MSDRPDTGRADTRLWAIAYLCRQMGAFPQQSNGEQRRFLRMIGLSPADSERVLTLLHPPAGMEVARPAGQGRRPFGSRDTGLRSWSSPRWLLGALVRLPDLLPWYLRCRLVVREALASPVMRYLRTLSCPIAWQPSAIAPVFHGYREFAPGDGVPGTLRVFYPSLEGSPEGASLLQGCGHYPLIIFLHGQCSQDPLIYRRWYLLPAQLARSGYIVAVPFLPEIQQTDEPFGPSFLELPLAILKWMRTGSEFQGQLLCPPATGVIGHSYGALVGAQLATQLQAPYVSLSGGWIAFSESEWMTLNSIPGPSLFMWGNGFSDVNAALEGAAASLWDRVTTPKHKLVFTDGAHWDYLPEEEALCATDRGPCDAVPATATDFATTFFAKYLPPERWASLSTSIGNDILPPVNWRQQLAPDQQFYAGAFMSGLEENPGIPGCSATHTWQLPGGATGTNAF